ncbi:MAG: hypothetical protein LUF00_10495 [Lachnospiraceae bacterium]|nr:hypothetical protein [Lachnospiraceae bacterium]
MDIYEKYCTDFKGFGGGIQKDDLRLRQFFDNRYKYREYDHPLFYDKPKFISRSLSGSYSLKKGDEKYEEYIEAWSDLFDQFSDHHVLKMDNRTIVYSGCLD